MKIYLSFLDQQRNKKLIKIIRKNKIKNLKKLLIKNKKIIQFNLIKKQEKFSFNKKLNKQLKPQLIKEMQVPLISNTRK